MALSAIHNGADAIYMGFPGFNARGRSHNFNVDQLKEIIEICHLYGVKVNLALNILIFQNELNKVKELLEQVLPLNPDALIVQDLGLINLIRSMSPTQVIHGSTQMTITNHEAIELLDDLNIKRFVLARENSIEEIKIIKKSTNKEIEVFVHGALCVAYSGQCFTSESIGGRSANRGQCAQSCRFAYDLIVDGKSIQKDIQKQYLVSPQDLCGISEIPQLLDIGVDSFKIEGRLKSPEYVAATAKEYRQAISNHKVNKSNSEATILESKRQLASTYSRGFFTGWLHGVNHQSLVDGTFSAHRGAFIGTIESSNKHSIVIKTDEVIELVPGDGLLWATNNFLDPLEDGAQIYEAKRISKYLWHLEFSFQKKLSDQLKNAKVYLNYSKNYNQSLQKSINDKNLFKRIPVRITAQLHAGKAGTIEMSCNRFTVQTTTSIIQEAKSKPTTKEFILNELASTGGTVFNVEQSNIDSDSNIYISQKELKELRRNLTDQLTKLRKDNPINSKSDFTSVNISHLMTPIANSKSKLEEHSNPNLNIMLRKKEQVDDLIDALETNEINPNLLNYIMLDFEFGRDYEESLNKLRVKKIKTALATTRILKPKEYNNLKHLQKLNPDAILVRNLGALNYFNKNANLQFKLLGDFSLNVSNYLTAQYLLSKGLDSVCLSYDLNHSQIEDLLSVSNNNKFEITIHQYMPSFHMEHCVFAAFLSKGKSFVDCGKPCEKHQIELKDQFGNSHFIKPDQECRNTMYNAIPYSAAKYYGIWKEKNLGSVRFEALNETGPVLINKIKQYQNLISGYETPEVITEELKLFEKYGLGAGTLSKEAEFFGRR